MRQRQDDSREEGETTQDLHCLEREVCIEAEAEERQGQGGRVEKHRNEILESRVKGQESKPRPKRKKKQRHTKQCDISDTNSSTART